MKTEIERAREMLVIAAKYIRKYWPGGDMFYDEVDCDGYCLADDCELAAKRLSEIAGEKPEKERVQ